VMTADAPRGPIRGLDLRRALRILRHSGRPDPLSSGADPEAQLQTLIDDLCDLSIHDGLTGLVNARFFYAALEREVDRSHRTGRTCALLFLDIDSFKHVNDTYGHPVGDLVLQAVARQLRTNLRGMDTAARVGGEEFAVILPECTPEDAIRASTRIHGSLCPLVASHAGTTIEVTVSGGLVWTDPRAAGTASALLDQADREMYRAKNSGRRSLCHPPVVETEVSVEERKAFRFVQPLEGADGS